MGKLILTALALATMAIGHAQGNLVRNGNMEQAATEGTAPEGWAAAGDPATVKQRLGFGEGSEGRRCAVLDCTELRQENPASHAMICQTGRFGVRAGAWYRLSFLAKQKGLNGRPLMVALVNMAGWGGMGLSAAVIPGALWERHELLFQATGDATDTMRLQFCYLSTGTLWLDDVEMVEADASLRPTVSWPGTGRGNLVPNGGFECGASGWGSVARYVTDGWAMPLNRLLGEVVEEDAAEGRRCLKVALGPGVSPVCYFDCMAPVRTPVRAALAGHEGWLPTTPGQRYALSALLRADQPGTTVRMVVQPLEGPTQECEITVGTSWERREFVVAASGEWSAVLVGPDQTHEAFRESTVWIDAVQFAPEGQRSAYVSRAAVEVGLSSGRDGNVFHLGEPVALQVSVANTSAVSATVRLTVTDFDDQVVARREVSVPPGDGPATETVDLGLTRRGFFRVRAEVNGEPQPGSLRLAVITPYAGKDSVLGMNHAYPWDHLVRECRDAGVLWVRDWSLKWHDVQGQPGAFDFAETDYQIDRPLRFGMPVLGLLPFPSSNWSSSAPPEVLAGDGYPALGGRTAWAPRSEEEFRAYVRACVEHYRGRVRWWQVFNEPIYTNHALPAELGYTGRDYGKWVAQFARAAREADPECRILAGIGGWPDGVERHFRGMFEAGALEHIDAVDVHTYPGLAPPETQEAGLEVLNRLMDEFGGRKPIWLTEHGYYADDDFEADPVQRVQGWNAPLRDERQAAAYSVRFSVILLANGAERIFYHAGTCPGLHQDNTEGTFFECDGAPRRIYPAVAAFAQVFGEGCKPLGKLPWGEGLRAYLFEVKGEPVLVAWSLPDAAPQRVTLADDRIRARDLMGNALVGREVGLSEVPVYLSGPGMTPEELAAGLVRRAG